MIIRNDSGKVMVRPCGCLGIVEKVEDKRIKFWNLFLCQEHGGPPSWTEHKQLACTVTHIVIDKVQEAQRPATSHEIIGLFHHLGRVQARVELHDRLMDTLKEALEN